MLLGLGVNRSIMHAEGCAKDLAEAGVELLRLPVASVHRAG